MPAAKFQKELPQKGPPSLSLPLKGFKGIPNFHLLFAIYLIRHWPALGSFLLGRARISTLLS